MNPYLLTDDSDIWVDIINNPTKPINLAIIIVAALIIIVALFSLGVSIYLAIKYVSYNRRENSVKLTGEQVARKLLDQNGLQNIAVSKTGSFVFGNSYSHYFHKIRLRRRTWQKTSLASLAMAAQKTGLAVLDKEGDKDMRTRIVLIPITIFGPFAFIPLVIIGVVLDVIVFSFNTPICTLVCSLLGLAFFLLSFLLQIMELKTEVKAQNRAYEMLRSNNMATEDELSSMKELFHLYNIEYVNNIILSFLELLYRVLMIVAKVNSGSSTSSSSD